MLSKRLAEVDRARCVACGACAQECPKGGPDYERMLRPDSGRNLRGMREMRENLPRRVY